MTSEVRVPDIGDYQGVPVIEVLVKDGDRVEKDQPLIVLESDKATMEVPSPVAGIVRGLKIKMGDKVSQGDVICTLEVSDGDAAVAPSPPRTPAAQPSSATKSVATPAPAIAAEVSAPSGAAGAHAGP